MQLYFYNHLTFISLTWFPILFYMLLHQPNSLFNPNYSCSLNVLFHFTLANCIYSWILQETRFYLWIYLLLDLSLALWSGSHNCEGGFGYSSLMGMIVINTLSAGVLKEKNTVYKCTFFPNKFDKHVIHLGLIFSSSSFLKIKLVFLFIPFNIFK